jgi:hypothetical protein
MSELLCAAAAHALQLRRVDFNVTIDHSWRRSTRGIKGLPQRSARSRRAFVPHDGPHRTCVSDGSMARRRLSSSAERLRRLQGRLLHVEHESHATGTWKASVLKLAYNRCVPAFAADLRYEKHTRLAFCSLIMCLASRRRSLCLPGLAYLRCVCGMHRSQSAPCVCLDVMLYQSAPRTRSAFTSSYYSIQEL